MSAGLIITALAGLRVLVFVCGLVSFASASDDRKFQKCARHRKARSVSVFRFFNNVNEKTSRLDLCRTFLNKVTKCFAEKQN